MTQPTLWGSGDPQTATPQSLGWSACQDVVQHGQIAIGTGGQLPYFGIRNAIVLDAWCCRLTLSGHPPIDVATTMLAAALYALHKGATLRFHPINDPFTEVTL